MTRPHRYEINKLLGRIAGTAAAVYRKTEGRAKDQLDKNFKKFHVFEDQLKSWQLAISFRGSFISPPKRERGKKDPGSGWSCVSQKVGDDKIKRQGGVARSQFCLS